MRWFDVSDAMGLRLLRWKSRLLTQWVIMHFTCFRYRQLIIIIWFPLQRRKNCGHQRPPWMHHQHFGGKRRSACSGVHDGHHSSHGNRACHSQNRRHRSMPLIYFFVDFYTHLWRIFFKGNIYWSNKQKHVECLLTNNLRCLDSSSFDVVY